jgi:hypothetical protein
MHPGDAIRCDVVAASSPAVRPLLSAMAGPLQNDKDDKATPPSATVRIAFAAVLAIFSLVAIEASCALFFNLEHDKYVFALPSAALAEPEELEVGYRTVYDRDLGWVFDHGTDSRFGERPNSQNVLPAMIGVFGSSFAYGGEVSNDETWPYYLSSILGHGVLNFGQTLYSTDQTLLHFEQKARQGIRMPLTIFTVMAHSIDGDVNVYKKFYYPGSHMAFTKPMFQLQNGRLVLLPNPISVASDRQKLADLGYVRSLAKYDYWYSHDKLPELHFPYTEILLSPEFWRQTSLYRSLAPISENNAHPATSLWDDPDISTLSLRIITEFFDQARQYETRPIIIYLPDRDEVTRHTRGDTEPVPMARIAAECQRLHWDCLFPLNDEASIFGANPLEQFSAGGHYNPTGNKAIARWIGERLKSRFIN